MAGFRVYGKREGFLGTIKNVDDYSGNIILTVDNEGHEILVPFNEDLLVKFVRNNKEMVLDLPEGLVD